MRASYGAGMPVGKSPVGKSPVACPACLHNYPCPHWRSWSAAEAAAPLQVEGTLRNGGALILLTLGIQKEEGGLLFIIGSGEIGLLRSPLLPELYSQSKFIFQIELETAQS